ncbi:hypothetical protein ADUPG1_009869, partial [Aduncisulcus paluster]
MKGIPTWASFETGNLVILSSNGTLIELDIFSGKTISFVQNINPKGSSVPVAVSAAPGLIGILTKGGKSVVTFSFSSDSKSDKAPVQDPTSQNSSSASVDAASSMTQSSILTVSSSGCLASSKAKFPVTEGQDFRWIGLSVCQGYITCVREDGKVCVWRAIEKEVDQFSGGPHIKEGSVLLCSNDDKYLSVNLILDSDSILTLDKDDAIHSVKSVPRFSHSPYTHTISLLFCTRKGIIQACDVIVDNPTTAGISTSVFQHKSLSIRRSDSYPVETFGCGCDWFDAQLEGDSLPCALSDMSTLKRSQVESVQDPAVPKSPILGSDETKDSDSLESTSQLSFPVVHHVSACFVDGRIFRMSLTPLSDPNDPHIIATPVLRLTRAEKK